MTTNTKVTIEVRQVGANFGTVGMCRSVRSGRILAESDTVRPLGFNGAALQDARQLAAQRGYVVVDEIDE